MVRVQKNNPQDLQTSENRRMFASISTHKGGHSSPIQAGFFYARTDSGFVPPCRCLMALLPLWWRSTGKAEPHFFSAKTNFLSVMISTEKQGLSGKHSTVQPSPAPRKRVSLHKFITEKDAKNCAYAFILSRGLLDEFRRYRNSTEGLDYYIICMSYLINLREEKI